MEHHSPIISAGSIPLPPFPQSRRSQQRWYRTCDLITICNWALLALQELHRGVLTRLLLQREPPVAEMGAKKDQSALVSRLWKVVSEAAPPFDRLKSDAALRRLRGYETGQSPILPSKRNEKSQLPIKGDICPAVVEEIALPPPGAKPVPISLLSTRAMQWLDKPETMLASKEEVTENLMNVPEKP